MTGLPGLPNSHPTLFNLYFRLLLFLLLRTAMVVLAWLYVILPFKLTEPTYCMQLRTEPIGSIPRPKYLVDAMQAFAEQEIAEAELTQLYNEALTDTIRRFEQTGSPVITDGEQTKPSFATYPVAGLTTLAPGGVVIPFADGHTRQLPVITAGPFHYHTYADSYLIKAKQLTRLPVKQAVIAVSAISLLYPRQGMKDIHRHSLQMIW